MAKQLDFESSQAEWPLRFFARSWPRQNLLRQIQRLLGEVDGKICVDIGDGDGALSWTLRQGGGHWHSLLLASPLAKVGTRLLGESVGVLADGKLPFEKGAVDVLVLLGLPQEVGDVPAFIAECNRVLKPTGRLILHVPHYKKLAVIPLIRRILGLEPRRTAGRHSGYTDAELFDLLKDGFDVQQARTFSRFFSEAAATTMEYFTVDLWAAAAQNAEGPLWSSEPLRKALKLNTTLYPLIWLAGHLDWLLFFTRGYHLIAETRRHAWRPRRIPVLADGRSIAEATINTKIGTAAPF